LVSDHSEPLTQQPWSPFSIFSQGLSASPELPSPGVHTLVLMMQWDGSSPETSTIRQKWWYVTQNWGFCPCFPPLSLG
jgi:hypothetical protein